MAEPKKTPEKRVLSQIGRSRLGRTVGLTTALGLASQMGADQQQQRYQDDIASQSFDDAPEPEDEEEGGDDPVLLELPKQSPIEQSEETKEAEEERSRQKGMRATQRGLSPKQSPEQRQESRTRGEAERAPRERSAVETDQDRAVASRTMRLTQAQQQDRQKRAIASSAQEKIGQASDFIQGGKKVFTYARRLGEIATLWGIVVFLFELNVQCFLTLFRIDIASVKPFLGKASEPEMYFCVLLDCCVFVTVPLVFLFPFIILMLILGVFDTSSLTNLF
jgi:hypothetical protein